MKENFKKLINSSYFPFIVLFIGTFILHIFMNAGIYDYVWFKKTISKMSIFDFIIKRYNGWTSRIFIETVLVSLIKLHIVFFKFINIFVITFIGILLSKLFVKKNNKELNWIIVFLIFIYNLMEMSTAGWYATSINYLWPLMCLLISFFPIKNYLNNKNSKWYINLLYIIPILFACNQEQTCAIVFGFYLCLIIYMVYTKKINYYNILIFILSTLSLLFILTCPGNATRNHLETLNNFPIYEKLNLLQKINLGVSSTVGIYLNTMNLVLFITSIICCIIIFKKQKNKIKKSLALIPIIIIILLNYLNYTSIRIPILNKITNLYIAENIIANTNKSGFHMIFSLSFGIFLFLIILYNIYTINKNDKKIENKIFLPLIFLAGLSSRLIMCFSPTIFASGNRTNIFFDFSMIIIMVILYQYMIDNKVLKNRKILFCFIGLISFLNYLRVLIQIMRGI